MPKPPGKSIGVQLICRTQSIGSPKLPGLQGGAPVAGRILDGPLHIYDPSKLDCPINTAFSRPCTEVSKPQVWPLFSACCLCSTVCIWWLDVPYLSPYNNKRGCRCLLQTQARCRCSASMLHLLECSPPAYSNLQDQRQQVRELQPASQEAAPAALLGHCTSMLGMLLLPALSSKPMLSGPLV